MSVGAPPGRERPAFVAFAALLLAPFVAQGAWRPLEHVFGPAGSAPLITGSALVIAAIAALLSWRVRGQPLWRHTLAGGLAAAALSAVLSLGVAGALTLLIVAASMAALTAWLAPRLPPALDGLAAQNRALAVVYGLAALSTVVAVARVSVFIGDPTAVELQAVPGEKFTETHSCLTAYVRASELANEGADNLYADPWWYGSLGLPPRPEGAPDPWRPFDLDNFSYPPTFLLITAPLTPLEGDFLAQRALWFGLNGLLGALGVWTVARWIEGRAAHRVLLLAPLLLGSLPVLLTLQVGNFHLAAMVFALLAMVALDRGHAAAGGGLLALTILSKISPGILGVVMLVQRRFREAAMAASFGVVLLGISVAVFGMNPVTSFVTYVLPRLSSGAAFPHMDTPAGIATNMAPFGLPFKMRVLGFDVGDPWQVGPLFARGYTVVLLVLAVAAARRLGDRRDQAIRWMALLTLAAMQSPFSPAYSTIALLWATTLLATEVRRTWHAIGLVALWPAILIVPQGLDLVEQSLLSIFHTGVTVGLSTWLVLRAPRGEPTPSQAP